jgi:hypothetical protein
MDRKEMPPAAQEALRRYREAGGKPERLDPVARALKKPTPRNCIAAKCWQCQGGDADPKPKERIRDCQIVDCGIWPLRPYTRIRGKADYYGGVHYSAESDGEGEES